MSPLVYVGAGLFAASAVIVVVILACALRRALNETDEWCDQVDQDIDAGRPFYQARVAGPDELCEVDAVVFDWPIMTPSARVIEFPRRGDAA